SLGDIKATHGSIRALDSGQSVRGYHVVADYDVQANTTASGSTAPTSTVLLNQTFGDGFLIGRVKVHIAGLAISSFRAYNVKSVTYVNRGRYLVVFNTAPPNALTATAVGTVDTLIDATISVATAQEPMTNNLEVSVVIRTVPQAGGASDYVDSDFNLAAW